MVSKVASLLVHQVFTKISELSKTSKIALAIFGLLAFGFAAFALKKIYSKEVRNVSAEKVADVYVSISGNPAHMGHMHMIALAVHRLEELGYRINKVKVSLANQESVGNKVYGANLLKKENEMYKVPLPILARIKFLKAAIQQSKDEGVFKQDLVINYYEKGDLFSLQRSSWKDRKIFYVCGTDFANDMTGHVGKQGSFKHAVIVTRDGNVPIGIVESHTEELSRLIVCNNNETTSKHSSSNIQNGAYDQLPNSVRDEFRRLHEAAQ